MARRPAPARDLSAAPMPSKHSTTPQNAAAFSFPPSRLLLACRLMSEFGLSPELALQGTGLRAEDLERPDLRTSPAQFTKALCNLARYHPRPDAGLMLGFRVRASTYGMFGYAVLCAPTFRAALDTGVRFQELAGGLGNIAWHVEGDEAILRPAGDDDLRTHGFEPEAITLARDYHVSSLMKVMRDAMGPGFRPARTLLTGPPPVHADAIARAFECPIEFDRPCDEIRYSASQLDATPLFANPIAAAEVSETCAGLLDRLRWDAGTTRRVYHELTNRPGTFPDIEQVAAALHMTSRTLRRKLEAEGTSYRRLLDEVRHALAVDYLKSSMTVEAISDALGFTDAPSFRRAFRRWTGKSPSETRR